MVPLEFSFLNFKLKALEAYNLEKNIRKSVFGCVSISSLMVKGAHRCHSAFDVQGVNAMAALLHWQCQVILRLQRAA